MSSSMSHKWLLKVTFLTWLCFHSDKVGTRKIYHEFSGVSTLFHSETKQIIIYLKDGFWDTQCVYVLIYLEVFGLVITNQLM